ncbi:MAG: ABC transporter substrate-binding protein [Anaerolineales bacterium]|nr:ABC transporter substrate-binding protein [Anaerolineales bacterium]MCX7755189.1 ABC transporter substrate-binding protein [Anaerolineales bacterium]MDW8278770.1 ABC transporter substrate-binding protein [Anaerolineales bacterium]
MKRSLYALLSLFVLAGLVLAACGGGAATPAPAEPTQAPEQPTEPTPVPDIPIATFDGKSLVVPKEECNGDYAGLFQAIEAVDDYTVKFTLCRPDPAFLSKIAFSPFAIYPSEWLERTAADGKRTSEGLEKPVGTGPYKISEWKRGESVTFKAFENYWGQKPFAETLVIRWQSEAAGRLLELQAGTVDGIDNVGPSDFEVVKKDPNLVLVERPALNIFYIGMTNTFKPWDDVRVRKAIAYGIDRQRIVKNFYPAGSEVATHFTPCSIPNGCVGDPWYDFNPEEGRKLLAEAGFPNGFKTKLYYRDVVRGYLPQVANVAQDVQAQLKENLNIEAEIVVMESGAFIEASTTGKLDGLYFLGWGADYPHITNFLDFHFGASNPQFGNPFPEIYEQLVKGAQIADPKQAEPFYVAANNAIRELVPMVPVAHGGSGTAYRADVTNPQASPLTNEQFAVSDPGGRDVFIFMQNAEPISLFCADETDGESLRACDQVMEALYGYEVNGTAVVPVLAESCEPNADLTVWTCTLRKGVKFHDGTDFTSADVVATFNMGLNIAAPTHAGNTGVWEYYDYLWGLMKKPGK